MDWAEGLGSKCFVVLTCMDSRLDACGFLDDLPKPRYLIRNAGGRASADALRSLAAACAMGAECVLVVHHTDCAMAKHSEEELRAKLPNPAAAAEVDFLTIAEPQEALAADVDRVASSPLLPTGLEVKGFVFDLQMQDLRLSSTATR
jgi:carbonic anhydrase